MVAISNDIVKIIYRNLFKAFGPQHWWPAKTKFEVIVGAILTQNTNWSNVEKALGNLKKNNILSAKALQAVSSKKLSSLLKPAGYFNIKTKRLKNFIKFFFLEYDGSLAKMRKEDWRLLRQKLLAVNGIGPETADSILLYALDKPIFVVDAYTKRIFSRHNIIPKTADYHAVQAAFQSKLAHDLRVFNEYHALIVRVGKDYCKPNARCQQCPLNDLNKLQKYKSFRYSPSL